MSRAIFVAVVLALLLNGCGGGDGNCVQFVSSQEIRSDFAQVIDSASAALTVETNGEEVSLWLVLPSLARSVPSLASFEEEDTPEYRYLGIRHGVSRARAQSTLHPYPNEVLSYIDYAGWMEHSLFFIERARLLELDAEDPNDAELFETFNHSLGNPSRTNPVLGSATWEGVMAGFDISSSATEGNLIEGDAMITIDEFGRPVVDVALTGLVDRNTGRGRPSMSWSDLALAGGVFVSPGLERGFPASNPGLMGRFYGPNHEEVGGVFVRNQISGAFGASRE